jgi:hypothetical protein
MAHRYDHRNFMIFNVSELGSINFSEVLESTINTVRKSVDLTQTFVKWDSETTPPSVDGLTTKDGPHLYQDMLTILATSGWTGTDIIG